MFRSNSNDLDYLIQQFSNFESISKSARLASRIANIYLQRNDHKNAMEWLGHWLDFEPENEQVHRMIEHLDGLMADQAWRREKREAEKREANEKSKSSYFTMKNFLILGLAVWAFSYLKNVK